MRIANTPLEILSEMIRPLGRDDFGAGWPVICSSTRWERSSQRKELVREVISRKTNPARKNQMTA
jgi:hypothetical protein